VKYVADAEHPKDKALAEEPQACCRLVAAQAAAQAAAELRMDGREVSEFNGCRCVSDTRTVSECGKKIATLVLDGKWKLGPLGKSQNKIPRRLKTALGVGVITIKFVQHPSTRRSVGSNTRRVALEWRNDPYELGFAVEKW